MMRLNEPVPQQRVLVMQIIAASLVMGVLIFAGVVVFVLKGLEDEPTGEIVSMMAGVMAIVSFSAHLIIPQIVANKAVAAAGGKLDVQSMCGIYQTKMIVGLALLEGAAFFNLIAVFIEHRPWPLAIAGGLVIWMLARFPTANSVREWIESQQFRGE